MSKKIIVAASAYEEKYFISPDFKGLPEQVLEDLKRIAVHFVSDVGGTFSFGFHEDGEVFMEAEAEESDLLYDDIGSRINLRRIEKEYDELLQGLTTWYKMVYSQNRGG